MEEQRPQLTTTLSVLPESYHLFTTLLQSGVEVKTSSSTPLTTFLCQLPGFSAQYITSTVETIFLNGNPVDDLSLPFTGKSPTLALSASMPGLAGAIFRKNSIHSALRAQTGKTDCQTTESQDIVVTLKLFNSIAKERGHDLLAQGVSIKSAKVLNFLERRSGLCDYITDIELGSNSVTYMEFFNKISQCQTIHLKVINAHG